MKKALLILIGLLPFLPGHLLNHYMMAHAYEVPLSFGIIGFIFLVVWLLLGILIYSLAKSVKQAVLFAHIPAFVVLLLLVIQEIVLNHYWMNWFGLATQLFYLPLVSLASRITFFTPSISALYLAAFLLMLAVFYLGCRLRKRYIMRHTAA